MNNQNQYISDVVILKPLKSLTSLDLVRRLREEGLSPVIEFGKNGHYEQFLPHHGTSTNVRRVIREDSNNGSYRAFVSIDGTDTACVRTLEGISGNSEEMIRKYLDARLEGFVYDIICKYFDVVDIEPRVSQY